MSSNSKTSEEYWLPGFGLSRHIVLTQLRYFLGPKAEVRPYSHQGREGYLIKGAPLTKEQIEDLRRQSKEHERQEAIRMGNRGSCATEMQDSDINTPVVLEQRRRSPGHSSYRPYR